MEIVVIDGQGGGIGRSVIETLKKEINENNTDTDLEELEHIENIELEAKYVAKKIKELIEFI